MILGNSPPRRLPVAQTLTGRERLTQALAEQSARYKVLMEYAADAMLVVDAADGRLIEANGNAARMYGYEPECLIGQTLWQLLDARAASAQTDRAALYKTLHAAVSGYAPICECRQRGATGRSFNAQLRLVCLSKAQQTLVLIFVTDTPPVEPARHTQCASKMRDALTGLSDRSLFINRLASSIEIAHRQGSSIAVLLVKIDRFKYVNGTLGDKYGNRVLEQVARVISGCVRASDAIARFTGPQFAVLIEDIARRDEAAHVAEKIRQAIGARLVVDGQNMFLTTSTGIGTFPQDAQDAEGLLVAADHALTSAKELGGNGYRFFSSGLVRRTDAFLKLRAALHVAIERREFILHYQPKIAFDSDRMTGVEALIRWQDPQRGLVLPEEFIHAAEASGLIVPIGAWVLEAACRQLQAWHAYCTRAQLPPLRMAVNLSARQLSQPDLDLTLRALLQRFEIEPSMLELEITESAVMDDPTLAVQTLKNIHDLGVRIALDDLGTGYSSLNHLKQLPIDVVKIDRSFVTGIAENKSDRAIIGAIVQMAHALGMEVVAEGVDSEEQYSELKQCCCDAAQGFLLSAPVPADQLDALRAVDARLPINLKL